jgi:hypothetical protein
MVDGLDGCGEEYGGQCWRPLGSGGKRKKKKK